MNLARQEELLEFALDEVANLGDDLVNQVLEVTVSDATITVDLYSLPVT